MRDVRARRFRRCEESWVANREWSQRRHVCSAAGAGTAGAAIAAASGARAAQMGPEEVRARQPATRAGWGAPLRPYLQQAPSPLSQTTPLLASHPEPRHHHRPRSLGAPMSTRPSPTGTTVQTSTGVQSDGRSLDQDAQTDLAIVVHVARTGRDLPLPTFAQPLPLVHPVVLLILVVIAFLLTLGRHRSGFELLLRHTLWVRPPLEQRRRCRLRRRAGMRPCWRRQ